MNFRSVMQGSSRSAAAAAAASSTTSSPFVALGLLSVAGSFGSGRDRAGRSPDIIGGSSWRRARLRAAAQTFSGWSAGRVVMRFVIAGSVQRRPYMRQVDPADMVSTQRESATHGDILFLDAGEDTFRCGIKYLLWYRHAAATWPSARFFASGDDDIYVQLDHLEAELRLVHALAAADERVYWGLMLWKPYYNNATLEPSTWFGGWSAADTRALRMRLRVQACAVAASPKDSPECKLLRSGELEDARSSPSVVDPMPPFPMANGPLFAVSRELGLELGAEGSYPWQWLAALERTELVRTALRKRMRPFHVARKGCWPAGDAVLGYWVTQLAQQHRYNVTLVDSPFMIQHHPWPSSRHGAFSNSSIVIHELKDNRTDFFWRFAQWRGSGPFVPQERRCDTCAAMGWSSWPGSSLGGWRCCGAVLSPRARRRARRGRAKKSGRVGVR